MHRAACAVHTLPRSFAAARPIRPAQEKTRMATVLAAPEFAHFVTDWHLAPVFDTGDFVFLSGITGARPDLTVAEDPQEQFRDAFRFLQANLAAAGLDLSHVVEMTTYHVGLRRHLDVFIAVKDEFIAEPYPAWTAVGVSELITVGTLVEIRVIAKRR
jgi:enamine deaminase RidA (YjgF/YER057c/UK114 family)